MNKKKYLALYFGPYRNLKVETIQKVYQLLKSENIDFTACVFSSQYWIEVEKSDLERAYELIKPILSSKGCLQHPEKLLMSL